MELDTSNPNHKRRKADALARIACSSSESTRSGRGAVSGWSTCPLCGKYSKKKYALGRGIATHLHAVHTPWKPGKAELKKRRRLREREMQEAKRAGITKECVPIGQDFREEQWEPSHDEIEKWNAKVLAIVEEVEIQAAVNSKDIDCDTIEPNTKKRRRNQDFVMAGLDRNGVVTNTYRSSLPPFIQAAADGDLSSLKLQVQKSVDDECIRKLLDQRDRHLSTAESWAAGGGHLECLKFLLSCRRDHAREQNIDGAQKKVRRRDGKTALHYAARNGHVNCIRFLVESENCAVDEPSGDETTPLHMACFGSNAASLVYLIDAGADVSRVNTWGCSAAHWVAMTRNENTAEMRKVCSILRAREVSFVEPQKQGHSPLHKAAQRLNRGVIVWMLEPASSGGAGLTEAELRSASLPDEGGHTPADIWKSLDGDPEIGEKLAAYCR